MPLKMWRNRWSRSKLGKTLLTKCTPYTYTVRAPIKDTRHGRIEMLWLASDWGKRKETLDRAAGKGTRVPFHLSQGRRPARVRGCHAILSLSKTQEHALCR